MQQDGQAGHQPPAPARRRRPGGARGRRPRRLRPRRRERRRRGASRAARHGHGHAASSRTRPSPPAARSTTGATASTRPSCCATSTTARTSRLASGRVLREWEIVAQDREIEVAPGVRYEAWTYNGRVPGPTLRAREGELLRIHFVNGSEHPHTMHFHGLHSALMDGMPGIGENRGGGQVEPGESLHLRVRRLALRPPPLPLPRRPARRPHRPRPLRRLRHRPEGGRPEADELVMVMNGFDTNFDLANEVYAVNTRRLPLRRRADRGRARRAGADLPGQRARVRPAQLVPRPRQLLPLLPDRDLAGSRASSPTR